MEKDVKKDAIESVAVAFSKLGEGNKLFILGYMMGIQQEKAKKEKASGVRI